MPNSVFGYVLFHLSKLPSRVCALASFEIESKRSNSARSFQFGWLGWPKTSESIPAAAVNNKVLTITCTRSLPNRYRRIKNRSHLETRLGPFAPGFHTWSGRGPQKLLLRSIAKRSGRCKPKSRTCLASDVPPDWRECSL